MLLPLLLILQTMKMEGNRIPPAAAIIIHNDQPFPRHKEVISIGSKQFGKHTTATYPVIMRHGEVSVSQPVDSNKDGIWDSLFLEVTLPPYATDTLTLMWTDHPPSDEQQVTNVRFSRRSTSGLPEKEITDTFRLRGYVQDISKPTWQMEGPGIENDKVAFRVFFDHRNGKDIYGKLTTTPVLEKVGLQGSWHQLQDWGMDILKTGNSMGAGNFAVREAGADYPLVDADSTVFTQLYEGPLAASFRLDFYNWDAGTIKRKGSEVLTMLKGNYYYTTTLYLSLQKQQTLLQGFAHFYRDSLKVSLHNKRYVSLSTFGKQVEGDASSLGLAIMIPRSSFLGSGKRSDTAKLPNSCYVQMKTPGSISTLFFAGWERTEARFKDEAGFADYLQEVANRLEHPIRITMSTKL